MLSNFFINDLKTLPSKNGDLFHGLSCEDEHFSGFGEIYFTNILYQSIKGWKKHHEMTLNLIVLIGKVRFVICNESKDDKYLNNFSEIILNSTKKQILTINPNIWFAFQGLSPQTALITNIANIKHDDLEVETKDLNYFNFNWKRIK